MESQRLQNKWNEGKNMEYFAHSLVCFMYEFLGNFVLVFAVNASLGNGPAVGLVYFFLNCLLVSITGAHFNPAVTLGVWINKEKTWNTFIQLISYSMAQVMGSLVSVTIMWNLQKDSTKTD